MKKIFCFFSQRFFDPRNPGSGFFGKHVHSCQECRKHFEEFASLERKLKSDLHPHDDAVVGKIMAELHSHEGVSRPKGSPLFQGLAPAALVVGLVGMTLMIFWPRDGVESAVTIPEPGQMDGGKVPENPLVAILSEQELLRRDAGKLGSHLREHVILFRPRPRKPE